MGIGSELIHKVEHETPLYEDTLGYRSYNSWWYWAVTDSLASKEMTAVRLGVIFP